MSNITFEFSFRESVSITIVEIDGFQRKLVYGAFNHPTSFKIARGTEDELDSFDCSNEVSFSVHEGRVLTIGQTNDPADSSGWNISRKDGFIKIETDIRQKETILTTGKLKIIL